MPSIEPLQMTSNLLSNLKNFKVVAMSGNSVISSKNNNVSYGINFFDGSIIEISSITSFAL